MLLFVNGTTTPDAETIEDSSSIREAALLMAKSKMKEEDAHRLNSR